MYARLKEILVTQYIGAIAIGFVAAQGVLAVIAIAMDPVTWLLLERHSDGSIYAGHATFPAVRLLGPAIHAALDFVAAYLLMRWLYGISRAPAQVDETMNAAEEQ